MAATSKPKLGIKCDIYQNTGSYGTPVWAAIKVVRDSTLNPAWDLGDASSRASRVKLSAKTMMAMAVNATVRADDLDAGAVLLAGMSMTDDVIDLLVLDGQITEEGTRGVRAHFLVNLTSQPQGAGDVIYNAYDLMPGFSTEGTPKYVVVGASSALTETDPGS